VQVQTEDVPEALPVHPAGALAQVSSVPTALGTQPFAQASVCTMLEMQRCRERRSLVQVHVGELPEALPVHVLIAALHVASLVPEPGTQEFAHISVCSMFEAHRCRLRPSAVQTQFVGTPPQFDGGTTQHVGQSYASIIARPAHAVALHVFPPAAVHEGTHRPFSNTYAGGGIGQLTPESRGAPLSLGAASIAGVLLSLPGCVASVRTTSLREMPESMRAATSSPHAPSADAMSVSAENDRTQRLLFMPRILSAASKEP
jgi:hypothetical protein